MKNLKKLQNGASNASYTNHKYPDISHNKILHPVSLAAPFPLLPKVGFTSKVARNVSEDNIKRRYKSQISKELPDNA